MNRNILKPLAGGIVIGALVMGIAGTQAIALPPQSDSNRGVETWQIGPGSFSGLVAKVKPAVVNISIVGSVAESPFPGGQQMPRPEFRQGSPFDQFFQEFFQGRPGMRGPGGFYPDDQPSQFRAVGSGFIISADGYVVTNNHVVERADEIEVVLQDGERFSATVQGRDPKTDLALLKVDTDQDLPFVELGDSDAAEVGDWVLAVGNPFGLGGSVTAGIISARGRDIQAGPFDDFLQVDAPINRGNSGGPLFDAHGKVIGINTAIYSPSGGSVGIGFAIPAVMAGEIIEQLKSEGVVHRGWLGVQFQAVNAAVAASLGLDETAGALVADVVAGSPAQRAGLKTGDVILSVDGESLDDAKDLPRIIANTKAGTELDMKVLRAGKTRNVSVEIGSSEAEEVANAGPQPAAPAGLGMHLSLLNEQARRQFGIPEESTGVLVTGVERNTPAAKAGIRPGQLISMVGQSEVRTPQEMLKEIDKVVDTGRDSVLLLVEQQGGKQFVTVELSA